MNGKATPTTGNIPIVIDIFIKNSKKILISADFGKYNINNFDTNFSKNVLVDYINKKIYSEYLDFSICASTLLHPP